MVIGLFGGFVGGLLGIGGSIVLIPAMTEVLGPNQHLYQAAAMIVNFFVVVPAVVQHRRARAIEPATVVRLVPLAVLGVVVGVALSESRLFAGDREPYLRGVFGLFLLFLAGSDLYRLLRPRQRPANEAAPPGLSWPSAAAVALPTGLIAGLLGVGGGMLAVPLQRRFLGVPTRNAIANSATVIIATSLIGASVKNYALASVGGYGWQPLVLAGLLIPSAILSSLVGSHLTHRVPVRGIKVVFFVVLMIAAVRLTYGAARSVSSINSPVSASMDITHA